MDGMSQLRSRLFEFIQAPLPTARSLLSNYPELLSESAERDLATLIETAGKNKDWDSQAVFRNALALILRAREVGTERAVDEAAQAERAGVTDELTALAYRAVGAQAKYRGSGSADDLAEEIASWEAVLGNPVIDRVHPGVRWGALVDSGAALLTRWQQGGQMSDLDTAIRRWRQVIAESGSDAQMRPMINDNLSVAYISRYRATGVSADLTAAVETGEAAVAGAAKDDGLLPKFRADLAGVLQDRYDATGDLSDLERAIALYDDALRSPPRDDSVRVSIVNNFATALRDRFTRTGNQADWDRAEELSRRAAGATAPTSVHYASHLSNLATYSETFAGELQVRRQLAAAGSANPALRAALLYNLATSLLNSSMYVILTSPASSADDQPGSESLYEAIDVFEQAIDAAEPTSADYALYHLGCGQARRLAFSIARDKEAALDQITRGMEVLETAVNAGMEKAPDVALKAARLAGDWFAGIEYWELAAVTYRYGLDAGEHLLRVQVRRAYKEAWLETIGDLSAEAAYAAARTDDGRAAVLALERGRAVLLADALGLRDADLNHLRASGRPELPDRFATLVERWNQISARDPAGYAGDSGPRS